MSEESSKAKIESLMEIVKDLYLADDIPWVIGYSGGKDSTAALQLVWMAISTLPKEKTTLEGEDLAQFKKLLTLLDDVDDVQNVYHNVELGE